MVRTIAIWVFGLLASAIVGGVIGMMAVDLTHDPGTGWLGALAGIFGFACLRLWLAAPSRNSK
jgi:uncharacterized membrane protein YeaQ/YmgE (transglycosylase-associated protein family)